MKWCLSDTTRSWNDLQTTLRRFWIWNIVLKVICVFSVEILLRSLQKSVNKVIHTDKGFFLKNKKIERWSEFLFEFDKRKDEKFFNENLRLSHPNNFILSSTEKLTKLPISNDLFVRQRSTKDNANLPFIASCN